MILASHVIIAAYGFWLPNDQRGSWSDFVRKWELSCWGPATKVQTTRSVAHYPYDRQLRHAMERTLDYPPVKFNGTQALWIARAFAAQVETSGFEIYACAILPRHTHFVVGRHRYNVEQITNLLKGAATRMLIARGLHPMRDHVPAGSKLPSPWTTGLWKVFLDSNEDVERSVRYVQQNPGKDGKKPQKWSFVRAYQG